jgi:adenosine/AMP kinase
MNMQRFKKSRMLFVLLGLAVVLTACGGGGGGGAGGGTTITPLALSNFQTASIVIGQPTFTTGLQNRGGSTGQNTLAFPFGNPLVLNGRLYLPDYGNHRVLGFNAVPAGNNASADFVLGKADLVTGASSHGSASNQMYGPQTVKSAGGRLFVDEWNNNRVLIWNTAPTTTQAPADIVVGQTGFGSTVTSCTPTGLRNPESIEVAGGKLIVSDGFNNRVLIWNSIPASNGAPADVVLGQNSFTSCAANDDLQTGVSTTHSTSRTLDQPAGLWSDGTRLIVSDAFNHRVLIWNSIPTTNFKPADLVIGQSDFTHHAYNDDIQSNVSTTVPSARTLNHPYCLDSNGAQLVVCDNDNNRVLIWSSIPTTNFAPADVVLGQGDFTHNIPNDDLQSYTTSTVPSARTLAAPAGAFIYGKSLIVSDKGNSRYLIYQSP